MMQETITCTSLYDKGNNDKGMMEVELIHRILEDDDRRAMETMFSAYEGLLCKLARTYSSTLLPFSDAYQVAAVGFMKALRGYDPAKGVNFKTYAYPNVEGELKKFYRDNAEMIRLPRRLWKLKSGIKSAESALESCGKKATVTEIAGFLDVPEEDVIEAMAADNFLAPLSTESPINSESDSRLDALLGAEDPRIEELEDGIALVDAILKLPENHRRVVALRMEEGNTQKSVAREMGISQMQVSRLQNKAFGMLKDYMFINDPGELCSNY